MIAFRRFLYVTLSQIFIIEKTPKALHWVLRPKIKPGASNLLAFSYLLIPLSSYLPSFPHR